MPAIYPISGQLFFRDMGDAPTNDGRKLVMVVGIIAVPRDDEAWPFKTEHQYVTVGDAAEYSLTIIPNTGVDRTAMVCGMGAGSLVLEPIWRC